MKSPNDYKVGYGRPPRERRFQPGQSGNPRGRPRKRTTVAEDLHAALMQSVKVLENGRTRTMTVQSLIFRNMAQDAARKNLGAARLLFALGFRYEPTDQSHLNPADLEAADRAILDDYIAAARDLGEVSDSEA